MNLKKYFTINTYQKISEDAIFRPIILLIVCVQFLAVFQLSMTRYYNFDEFQVLYASAALLRGKAYFGDNIGGHFPLANIFFSWIIGASGFKTTTLLIGRIVMMFCILAILVLAYKICRVINGSSILGLAGVSLILSSLAFIHKGIEIRHDVFNALFNVASIYYALIYFRKLKIRYLLLSAFFMGCSLAATQKAIFWNFGIAFPVFLYIFWLRGFKDTATLAFQYVLIYITPLIASLAYLVIFHNDIFQSFMEAAILRQVQYLAPPSKGGSSFLYSKFDMLKLLFYDNGGLYTIGLIAMLYYPIIILYRKDNKDISKGIIGCWGLSGLAFYLYMKRPFYQSFLPTIPALSLLCAFFVKELIDRCSIRQVTRRKNLVYIACIFSIIFFPSKQLLSQVNLFNGKRAQEPSMRSQMENVSFCLDKLEPNDVVLSLTQQQIFFDPLLCCGLRQNKCGSIQNMDAMCLKNEMIKKQCKIIINDHRTMVLRQRNIPIDDLIRSNYFYIGVGDIFIPGFVVEPNQNVGKEIWIEGNYFCRSSDVLFDGKYSFDGKFFLEKKIYTISNPSNESVLVLYSF